MLFDIPNYGRTLPPLKGEHEHLVPKNIKLPRHTTVIGYIWVKSIGKWIVPTIPVAIMVKGVKIAHAIYMKVDRDSHQHKVTYRLWEGRDPINN
jgi:hypothetical protein